MIREKYAMRSRQAQAFLAAMDAELAVNAEASGMSLAFSAAEQQTLADVADHIDRKTELAALYGEAEDVRVKVALATELRLTEASITRLLKTVDMCAPEAEEQGEVITPTQVKARAAANSRWKRERMRKRAEQQRRSG
jgi:hypothetical protein